MIITAQDQARLKAETEHLFKQLKGMGAAQVILFSSVAQGRTSLFSDIDLRI